MSDFSSEDIAAFRCIHSYPVRPFDEQRTAIGAETFDRLLQAGGFETIPPSAIGYGARRVRLSMVAGRALAGATSVRCRAAKDGECSATFCPQNRDGESMRTGRHCPIDVWEYED